jgi:hypothetical protein
VTCEDAGDLTDLDSSGTSQEFGLAENSAGDLWKIDREEASRVGLLDGTYRQSRMSETIGSYLDSLAG